MDFILASHPIEIYRACDLVFKGEPWIGWEPETVLIELEKDITPASTDKLMAVQAVAASAHIATSRAAAFEKTIHAFCNNVCVMDVVQPPEIEEICYGVSQIIKIIKEVHKNITNVKFVAEIPIYVAVVGQFRDWVVLPRILSFAQKRLDSETGLAPNSKLRRCHQKVYDTVYNLYSNMKRSDARELLESPDIKELEKDDAASLFVRRLIGALLYDPTLEYKNK